MTTQRLGWVLALGALLGGSAIAGPAPAPGSGPDRAAPASPARAAPAAPSGDPPAGLVSGDAARGTSLDPIFAYFKLERLRCKFSEQKRIALLARPLTSAGMIYFDRDKGIARIAETPRRQEVVLTRTSLRIKTDRRSEEIPLDKSKDLRTFALVFPTLLRGERAELEASFDIGLYGKAESWWALAFTPRTDSLRKLVHRVVVFGKAGEVVSLQITEASGDVTETRLTEIQRNSEVPDAEIAAAFAASGP